MWRRLVGGYKKHKILQSGNVSSKSNSISCLFCNATSLALFLAMVPSEWYFILKIHLHLYMVWFVIWGIRIQVCYYSRMLNSFFIATFHFGDWRAEAYEVGLSIIIGEAMLRMCFDFNVPIWTQVTMGCFQLRVGKELD